MYSNAKIKQKISYIVFYKRSNCIDSVLIIIFKPDYNIK